MTKQEKYVYMRRWRAVNTDHRRAYIRQWRTRWRKTKAARDYTIAYKTNNREAILRRQHSLYIRNKNRFDLLKNKPCYDCQGWFEPCQMDFDHRNPKDKKYSLSKCYGRLLPDILEEIKKCDLVCANCHRLRTFKRRHYASEAYLVGHASNNKLSTYSGTDKALLS